MFNYQRDNAPLRRPISIEDVGGAAAYLLSDLSRAVTGEIHYVDSGYHIVAMPRLATLKSQDEKAADEAAE
jgi:enoyl-[acyl-carrier protein] reductase I